MAKDYSLELGEIIELLKEIINGLRQVNEQLDTIKRKD